MQNKSKSLLIGTYLLLLMHDITKESIMSLDTDINRCVIDMVELVKTSFTNDLLEARTTGKLNMNDEELKLVVQLVTKATVTMANRTTGRITNALNG